MIKQFLATVLLVGSAFFTQAASIEDVENSEEMTWYGIDYSQAHFLNFGAYLSENSIKKALPRWAFDPFGEDFMDTWHKKYKKTFTVDIKTAHERNEKAKYSEHMGTKPYEMSMDDVKTIVSEYDIEGEGYGLLYIVESFDNVGVKKSSIWVVAINKADKSVIDAKKYSADTYGDWAQGVYQTVKQSGKWLK